MSSSGDDLNVRRLSGELIEATASLLARAMEVDPAYMYMFADAGERARGLTAFFAGNLRAHLPHGCTYVGLDTAERVIATVTLRPPGGVPMSRLRLLFRGLLPFLLEHGREPVVRMLWLKKTYDELETEAARGRPHSHVHMMAVTPGLQGTGIGSRLLNHVLSLRTSSQTERATVLTTHLERNVVFYARAGFEVVAQRSLQPPGGVRYPVWLMRA